MLSMYLCIYLISVINVVLLETLADTTKKGQFKWNDPHAMDDVRIIWKDSIELKIQ